MARGNNLKFKLLTLKDIMISKTDEEHWLTMSEILKELEKEDISAERKSIYKDLEDLEKLGVTVEGEQRGRLTYYHVVERPFELPELKLLVDAIQSSKFITVKKSGELIKKIESFCSEYEAKQLQRQVFIQDRIKAMNESIYYSVDGIHSAISENKKIKFRYYRWDIHGNMEFRTGEEYRIVSPWALSWDDENYYLIAFDSKAGKIKHYRVDKMLDIESVNEKREGKEFFEKFNVAEYAKKNFSMFGGEETSVTVCLKNSMCSVFYDRFGKDITFTPVDDEHSNVRLSVALSDHFITWIFALGPDVKIVGPDSVLREVDALLKRLNDQYKKD